MSFDTTDMIVGVDIANKNSKDSSALTVMCTKCNSIVFLKLFDNEKENYLSIGLPKKCKICGQKFIVGRYKVC